MTAVVDMQDELSRLAGGRPFLFVVLEHDSRVDAVSATTFSHAPQGDHAHMMLAAACSAFEDPDYAPEESDPAAGE